MYKKLRKYLLKVTILKRDSNIIALIAISPEINNIFFIFLWVYLICPNQI
jgi:hypothetical protein